jgi:hypothetical protein
MFSLPAFFAQTPTERNEQRMESLNGRLDIAEADLRRALARLADHREAMANMTEKDWAGLDIGQVQNLGNSTGHFVSQVQRAIWQTQETLTEITVIGSGFEAVS